MWVSSSALILALFFQQDVSWLEERNKTLLSATYGNEEGLDVSIKMVQSELSRLESLSEKQSGPRYFAAVSHAWDLLGEEGKAGISALKWHEAEPGSGACALLLSRIYLDRAKEAELRIYAMRRPDLAAAWKKKAFSFLDRELDWDSSRPMDSILAKVYTLVAKGEDPSGTCRKAIRKWGSDPGVEEFWLVLGWVTRGEERIRACDEALKIRPGFGRALFLRGCGKTFKGDKAGAVADFAEALEYQPLMKVADQYWMSELKRNRSVPAPKPNPKPVVQKKYQTRKIHSSASREVWMMDPNEIQWAMQNFESEMKSKVTVSPTSKGLRITSINSKRIGIFRGLKANDVLRSMNGHSVKSLADIKKIQNDPRNRRRPSMTLVVHRDGRNMVLEYRSLPKQK